MVIGNGSAPRSPYRPSPITQNLAPGPGWHRPHHLGVRHVGWPDRHPLAVLPLFDGHRLERVDAALVELDLAVEGDKIKLRDGVADRLRVQAAGRLDRLDVGDAARG